MKTAEALRQLAESLEDEADDAENADMEPLIQDLARVQARVSALSLDAQQTKKKTEDALRKVEDRMLVLEERMRVHEQRFSASIKKIKEILKNLPPK